MKQPVQYERSVEAGMYYLGELLRQRITARREGTPYAPEGPVLPQDDSPYGQFLATFRPTAPEYVLLLLALLPEVAPGLVDDLLAEVLPGGGDFPALGGMRGKQHRGFLPTGDTARFLLGGSYTGARTQVQSLLQGRLSADGILQLDPAPVGEPLLAGRLRATPEWLALVLEGRHELPSFSAAFPARLIKPRLDWDDLILTERTREEVRYLRNHLEQQSAIRQLGRLERHFRPGYRALFHGPPGTGKTLTAGLLGHSVGAPVFRIDLSAVVSKYIGETEKNLAGLFDRAERQGWILFFDEADALFGKRTEVKESNDRFANQETSYLLQRIEDFEGTVILATNFRENLDAAFIRRFEAVVAFELPGVTERERLWRSLWPEQLLPDATVDLPRIAKRYTLTGAAIANVVRFVATEALARGAAKIGEELLLTGVRREYEKDNRDWIN